MWSSSGDRFVVMCYKATDGIGDESEEGGGGYTMYEEEY